MSRVEWSGFLGSLEVSVAYGAGDSREEEGRLVSQWHVLAVEVRVARTKSGTTASQERGARSRSLGG